MSVPFSASNVATIGAVNMNVDDMELRELAEGSDQIVNLSGTRPENNEDNVAPYSEVVFKYDNLIDKWSVLPDNVIINEMTVDGVIVDTVINEVENTSEIRIKYPIGYGWTLAQ